MTLRWNAATTGDPATAYLLEAGTATGASNVGVMDVGNVTSFAVDAPNGIFFVGVKGVTACGTGSASNEVVVSFP